ncbi:MAG TPA: UDP-glucose 4-epimerase GalE [Candidatus Krumholzibacteria bacterium]|nr:UDP-glucose 4-epimerase GalE [Candidatus Krumholzibacteria bacterium]
MKLCVTGGAGYVGSVVCEHLLAAGHDVTVVDNFSTGHRDAVPEGCALVEGDIRDARVLARAIDASVEGVLHFAALSVVADSVRHPLDYFDNNVGGTVALLRAMQAVGVGRFVFSSTAAVYGAPATLPIDERALCAPENPYGWSKLAVEKVLEAAHASAGLRYVALRYFNAAGSTATRGEDHRPESHLIPIVLDTALGARASVTVFGDDYPTRDGTCLRDYIHVSDLADAHVRALAAMDGGFSGALNLGSESGFTVLEIIDACERITGRAVARAIGPRRAGDPPALVAASGRAAEVLGWTRRASSIDEIIRSAHAWRSAHPAGYAR